MMRTCSPPRWGNYVAGLLQWTKKKKEEKAQSNVERASEAFYLLLFQTNNAKMPREMLSLAWPSTLRSGIGCVLFN